MAEKNKPDLVEDTQKLFTDYSNNREKWAIQAQEDREFRLGQQWTRTSQSPKRKRSSPYSCQ